MHQLLSDVARLLEDEGLGAEVQLHRLICAENRSVHGFTGRSFWISAAGSQVFVATWTPRIYLLQDSASAEYIAVFAKRAIREGDKSFYDFAKVTKDGFALIEVQLDEFTSLLTAHGTVELDEDDNF